MSLQYAGDPSWRQVRIEHDGNFRNLKVIDIETGKALEDVYSVQINIARNWDIVTGWITYIKGSGESLSRDGVIASKKYSVMDNTEMVRVIRVDFQEEGVG